MKEFYDLCKQYNLKITPQRVAIYKVLMLDISHPTADGLWQKVRKTYPNISLDTVNRALIGFSELGIIDTISSSGQGKKYDPNRNPHHHMKCIKCEKIIDFYNKKYDKLHLPSEVEEGFKVLSKKVVLTGICKKCLNKNP